MLAFADLGRLNLQSRQLAIDPIQNSYQQREQCSNQEMSESVKERHA